MPTRSGIVIGMNKNTWAIGLETRLVISTNHLVRMFEMQDNGIHVNDPDMLVSMWVDDIVRWAHS
jgi:hypothetical protein